MGPRFVNVEYQWSRKPLRQTPAVSMGPRFVNVEYQRDGRLAGFGDFGFNGATFCERGIRQLRRSTTYRHRQFQWGHVL